MSVTSNWSWSVINRGKDISTSGGVQLERNNWTLTRTRISDDVYTSELGDISASLSGFNGGVTETVAAPVREVVKFDTARNWVRTTDEFVDAGYNVNGRRAYVQAFGTDNIPNPNMWKVIWCVFQTGSTTGGRWVCAELSGIDISNKVFASYDEGDVLVNYARGQNAAVYFDRTEFLKPEGLTTNGSSSPSFDKRWWYDSNETQNGEAVYWNGFETTAEAIWYDGANWIISEKSDVGGTPTNYFSNSTLTGTYTASGGWSGSPQVSSGVRFDPGLNPSETFVGESYASISSESGDLYCTSDVQSYQPQGVDWYTQTQTWTYRDEWRVS